jgi:hypothetical protein
LIAHHTEIQRPAVVWRRPAVDWHPLANCRSCTSRCDIQAQVLLWTHFLNRYAVISIHTFSINTALSALGRLARLATGWSQVVEEEHDDDLITVRGGARDDSSDYNKQTYN